MGRVQSTQTKPPGEFRYRLFFALFVSIGVVLVNVTDLPIWSVILITALATRLIEGSTFWWYGRRTA